MWDVAIIGGTGIGSRLAALGDRPVAFRTSTGLVSGHSLDHQGIRVLLIARHSSGHSVPPHAVNYRGFSEVAVRAGVKGVLASAAVGCLNADWTPGTFVVCDDFIDLTFRNLTLFTDRVEHTDFSTPMPLASSLGTAIPDAKCGGVYVGLNGPRYETPAEIELVRRSGGNLVGMTATSEAIVMREAGIPYGCLAIVTNLAAGMTPGELSHGEVVDVMQSRGQAAVDGLLRAALLVAAL